jgi:hypothetical protein
VIAATQFSRSKGFSSRIHPTKSPKANISRRGTSSNAKAISYKAIPFTSENILSGTQILKQPPKVYGDPKGWHSTRPISTEGNNGRVSIWPQNNTAKSPFTSVSRTEVKADKEAAVNVFYFINMFHGLLWVRGFDEAAGNFQKTKYVIFWTCSLEPLLILKTYL